MPHIFSLKKRNHAILVKWYRHSFIVVDPPCQSTPKKYGNFVTAACNILFAFFSSKYKIYSAEENVVVFLFNGRLEWKKKVSLSEKNATMRALRCDIDCSSVFFFLFFIKWKEIIIRFALSLARLGSCVCSILTEQQPKQIAGENMAERKGRVFSLCRTTTIYKTE